MNSNEIKKALERFRHLDEPNTRARLSLKPEATFYIGNAGCSFTELEMECLQNALALESIQTIIIREAIRNALRFAENEAERCLKERDALKDILAKSEDGPCK